MKRCKWAALVIVASGVLVVHAVVVRAGQDALTTRDAVYSAAQARRGQSIYTNHCEACHGPNGAGGGDPSLTGPRFISNWTEMTVAQLFDRTRSSMPKDNPQSLSRAQTTDAIAYLLQVNGFPAGSFDLPSAKDSLGRIKFVAP